MLNISVKKVRTIKRRMIRRLKKEVNIDLKTYLKEETEEKTAKSNFRY